MSPPFVDPPATEHATAPVFDSFAPTSVPEVDVAMMSDHMANSQANPLPAYEEWTVPNITISPAVVEGSQPSMELPEQDFSSVADDFYSTPPIAIVPPSVVNTPFIDKENVAPLPMPTLPNEQSWSASAVDEPSLSRTEPSLSSTEPSWFPFEEPSLPTPTIALREPAVSRRRRNIPLPHDPLLAETALPSYGTPSTHRHEKVSRNRHNPYTKKYEERTRDPRPRPKLSNTSPQDDLLDGLDAFSSLPTVSPMGRRSRPSSRRHRHQPLAGSLLFSDVSFIKGEMHVGYPPGFEDPYVLREVDRLLSQDVTVTPPSPEPEEPTEPVCEHDALADAFANTTLEPTNEDPAQASNEDEGDDDQEERVYTEKDIFGVDTDDEGFDSDATRGPQTPAASEEVVDAFLESVVAQVRLTNPTDLDFFYPEFSPVMTADEKDAAMLASLMQRTSV
ncbi:hypothetical protein FA95DRAFT_1076250 [Auriscalpium vulgare]|uniref:Uncharacterized protein n=1 Tax=Auriscalpium vulgare TaxID=40419 RepID=A0ACB8RXS7_9AGAM|nr:hypothetical protein FA95DRAFT_1076250 [Auriscalpium vulgare]